MAASQTRHRAAVADTLRSLPPRDDGLNISSSLFSFEANVDKKLFSFTNSKTVLFAEATRHPGWMPVIDMHFPVCLCVRVQRGGGYSGERLPQGPLKSPP